MKKIMVVLISLVSTFFLSNPTIAQGCSDAGFCTVSPFKPRISGSAVTEKNSFTMGGFFGMGDYDIAVYGAYLQYSRTLNAAWSIDARLNSLAQNGNDIAEFGLSDLLLNANYAIQPKLQISLGAKIPLADGGKSRNNLPLPMDYQSSLGTLDLIAGISYQFKRLQLAAALQQPLTQNQNRFLSDAYPTGSPLRAFQSTNQFKRSGDILLRASYPIPVNKKFSITPSLLPIFHLSEDRYTDALNIEKTISGSDGLTLNGTLFLDYRFNTKNSIQVNFGVPFIIRDARPDGLTRSFVVNAEYRIGF